MPCGLPVVVTRVGGMKETLRNNEHGFSIQPNDLDSLYESLIILIKDWFLRERMGQVSRVWVEQGFSINIVVEKYFHFFTLLSEQEKESRSL